MRVIQSLKWIIIAIGLPWLVFASGCTAGNQAEGTELAFETIENASDPRTIGVNEPYPDEEPAVAIITDQIGADRLGAMVSTTTKEAIASLNYEESFVLILFLGQQPFVHPGLEITEIGYVSEESPSSITVNALVRSVPEVVDSAISSPYHAVQVMKPEGVTWEESLWITLTLDDSVFFTEEHAINEYTIIKADEPD